MKTLPILAILAACAAKTTVETADTDAPILEAETRYYLGTTEATDPTFGSLGTTTIVLLRQLDPEAGEIHEVTTQRDLYSGDLREVDVVYSVTDDELTGSYDDAYGTVEISGELDGEAWDWTIWNWAATYADGPFVGSTLFAEVELEGEVLTVDQEARSPSDHLELTLNDRYEEVDEPTYAEALDGL